jgi:putative transposase
LDDKILALYAGGMTVRDISSQLSELYGTDIGRDTVSRITDAVLEDVVAWRSRPLDPVYAIVYLDAMVVKVREDRSVQNRTCFTAAEPECGLVSLVATSATLASRAAETSFRARSGKPG